jgi:hypothetical protein
MSDHDTIHHPDRFEVAIGDENLNFRTVVIDDPVPTGRQILKAAGAHPVEDFVALAVMPDGALEDLRLDELFDLRRHGVEQVVILRTDRSFRLFVDGKDISWGKSLISGLALKRLAGVDPATHDMYQEVRGADDLLIRNTDLVDLSKPGVEKFFSAIAATTEGLEALPPRDVTYLEGRGLAYEVAEVGGQHCVVLRGIPLPPGKFDAAAVDVLIQIPPGYPDCAPDMFYCLPWLKLAASGCEPRATQARLEFRGQAWQRWSRHNSQWRPGVDGLHTMVKRVDHAFAEAA